MLKALLLVAQNNVSDARMEYLSRDRLSRLLFLGFDLGTATPYANTRELFREKLIEAGALDMVFADFDRQFKERGYLAMGCQIIDVPLVAAPKQRNAVPERKVIKAGKSASEIWPYKPARAAQKDNHGFTPNMVAKPATWAKPRANGKPDIDIAIPSFGYKSSVPICRTFGFIRKCNVTDGARFDGQTLRDVVTSDNTASDIWAGIAYRSQANEV